MNIPPFRASSKTARLTAALASCCVTVLLLVAVVSIGDDRRAEQIAKRTPAVQPAAI
jgi:hypothetical protein